MNADPLDFIRGGGELGRLIAEHDWTSNPLGALDEWPQSLRSALSICLHSSFPTAIYWGPDLLLLYNDAWAPIPGERHPAALGRPAREVWSDIWDVIEPQFEQVVRSGEGFSTYDQMLPMVRNGAARETYWNYSFTPIRGEDGRVVGIFNQGHETTDRVLFERSKQAEVERLRRMFDQAPGFIAMLRGPEHVFELTNGAYAQLIGHRDVLGKSVAEALPEVSSQGFVDLLDQVYATGEPFVGNSVAVDLQREPEAPMERRFVDFIFQPVLDADGSVSGVFLQGADVTEQVLAQEALLETEARFAAIANSVDQMIWSTRPDGYHDFYNQRWYDFTGMPEGSTDGEEWNGMFHPDDQERAWAVWRQSLASGDPYHIEYRLRHRSGEYRWVLGRAQCVRDSAGKITRWFGTCTDIQEIVEAREVLAKSKAALEAAVEERTRERNQVWEISNDLFAVMGMDGFLKAINPAWSVTLGYDRDTLLAMPFSEQVHADDHAKVHDAIETLRRGEPVLGFEDRLRHADGTWRTINWNLVPGDGNVFYAVGRDVTAERQAAAELELAQEALRQSQKMEAMGQLTGGVAHDFNNLLTPIIGGLDLLQKRGVGDERAQRAIAGALASSERAKTLVQRLLAFARRQPLQPKAIDLTTLVNGMADLIGSTTGPQVRILVQLEGDLPPALGDANQLEMALLNLAVNARDAMPEGGTLTVAAAAQDVGRRNGAGLKPGRYVRLSVSDTGTGMDADTLARAVEPFFSTKGIGKGTGLGLSMVHGLASQLGGGLTVASRPGVGTKVELWLPVASEVLQAVEGRRDSLESAGSGTVMLVDDEELVRTSTADILEELGYRVVEAVSAEDALTQVKGGMRPDLVITDHLMPGMNGVDMVRELHKSLPDLKVVVVSGYAEAEGVAPDLPRLEKPFRSDDLAVMLAQL